MINVTQRHVLQPIPAQQATPGRTKLPQADTRLAQDPATGVVHVIALAEDDLLDADLGDLDAASQARTGVAVEDGALADALAAGLQQRILLGVQAQTRRERRAARARRVAPLAPALVAVAQVPRRPVVPRRDDPAVVHQHAPHPPLHAVRALRRKRRQRHEVRVPCRPEPRGRREIERRQEPEVAWCAVKRVEDLQVCVRV